jgi:hypothetical protein
MMRTLWTWPLVLLVAIVWVGTARPADPQKGSSKGLVAGEEIIEILLLRQKSVQKDLQLSEDEAKTVREFTDKQHQAALEAHNLPDKERHAMHDHLARANERFLALHLTPAQRMRLEQISMQLNGLMWVARPAIARELGLTDDQKKKAEEYQKELHDKVKAAGQADSKEAIKEKLTALHKESKEKFATLLTNEQKAKWQHLTGKPFEGTIVHE